MLQSFEPVIGKMKFRITHRQHHEEIIEHWSKVKK